MICGSTEIAFPALTVAVAYSLGSVELVNHPLPHQHARFDATGFSEPPKLLYPLVRQPQPVYRRPSRTPPTVRQIGVTGGLGVLRFGRDLTFEFFLGAAHCSPT